MQSKSAQIVLAALALTVAVAANPAPVARNVYPRADLTATAYEFADKDGEAYALSDHGDDCVTLVSSWSNRWSSIEVVEGPGSYECFFWKDSSCGSVDDAFSLRDGEYWNIASTAWSDFDDDISSYKCTTISAQVGTAWDGPNKAGDSVPVSLASGGCVNLESVTEWDNQYTSVEINTSYSCTFYKDINCAGDNAVISSAAVSFVDFSNPPLPYYAGFDNAISSYKCASL